MTPPFFLADLVDYKQCTTLMMTYLLCTTLILGDGRYVMNRASRVSALRVTAAIAREEKRREEKRRVTPHKKGDQTHLSVEAQEHDRSASPDKDVPVRFGLRGHFACKKV